jgi:hypothetical protein
MSCCTSSGEWEDEGENKVCLQCLYRSSTCYSDLWLSQIKICGNIEYWLLNKLFYCLLDWVGGGRGLGAWGLGKATYSEATGGWDGGRLRVVLRAILYV